MLNIFKPALVLLAICAGVTLTLALVFNATKPIITQHTVDDLAAAKKQVLSEADKFTDFAIPEDLKKSKNPDDPRSTVKAIYLGTKDGQFVGTVYGLMSRGYDAAGVALTVGIDKSGKITGIQVGDQKETPGLGTKVLSFEGKYMKQYQDLVPRTDLVLVKNKASGDSPEKIDAVTGATITSRAVWRAVQGALLFSRQFTPEGGLR